MAHPDNPLSQSDRFSPTALAFAVLLHVALAAGLFWLSPFRPFKPAEDVIEVTVDKGGSPPAEQAASEPEPPQQAAPQTLTLPQPTPPAPEPAPEPERPKPEPPRAETPPPEPPPPEPPKPEPPKQTVEQSLPPPEPPPPPPTAMDFPKPAPAPAPAPPPQQPPRAQPQPQRPPPAAAPRPPAAEQAARPAPSPLRNPADVIIGPSGPTQNEYFLMLHRQLAQYRYYPQSARDRHQEGRVVVRLVIARDGRLIDARVDRTSGVPAIDAAEVETVKRAAPFPPLPIHVPGEAATFLIPVTYQLR